MKTTDTLLSLRAMMNEAGSSWEASNITTPSGHYISDCQLKFLSSDHKPQKYHSVSQSTFTGREGRINRIQMSWIAWEERWSESIQRA